MLLDFQTNVDNEKPTFYIYQVAKEFSVKADNKNKKFESYRIHCYQIKAKMQLIFM